MLHQYSLPCPSYKLFSSEAVIDLPFSVHWYFDRLLTIWFDYGQWSEVYEALTDGVKSIQIDNWLQVIPQLIARIDTQRQLVSRLIHQLLTDIGKQHPQVRIMQSK